MKLQHNLEHISLSIKLMKYMKLSTQPRTHVTIDQAYEVDETSTQPRTYVTINQAYEVYETLTQPRTHVTIDQAYEVDETFNTT